MKILSVEQIREADAFTIRNEPIADIDLMERAATACFYWLIGNLPREYRFMVFCGTGNNGGDGLAISRMLHGKGYSTEVFVAGQAEKMSPNCRYNLDRLLQTEGQAVHYIEDGGVLPELNKTGDIVIDALFGSGISREITGFQASVIDHINRSHARVISVDVPSGLFCDFSSRNLKNPAIIRAWQTLTFSPPKFAFFFPENEVYTGEWHLLEIGIMKEFTDNAPTLNFMIGREECRAILHPRKKFSHKGTYGHALLICGSRGKMGAAVLCAKACIRSGPGLVTAHIPESGIEIMQTAIPEVMVSVDPDPSRFSHVPELNLYQAIGTGPGLGIETSSQAALKLLIQNATVPLVIDADAINILGENKTWIPFVPKGSIYTPHPKEFERLAGKTTDDFERNKLQREFSVRHGVYVVLKGAHTSITTPDGLCFFNTTGNPGMATGGSGDVLTGIITGLMAQGYSSLESCILGVYLHGASGDLATEIRGLESLVASDLIENLGKSFISLYGRF